MAFLGTRHPGCLGPNATIDYSIECVACFAKVWQADYFSNETRNSP